MMSRSHWAISLLLVWHITALTLGGVPSPSDLPVSPVRHPQQGDPIAVRVTPVLDSLANRLSAVHRTIWAATGWARALARPYLGTIGVPQRFRMFANPPRRDEYVRVRYYVSSEAPAASAWAVSWMATELVYPAHPEDRVRVLQSFRDSYRDKAMETSLSRFHAETFQSVAAVAQARQSNDALAPVAGYFGSVFERRHLAAGERIVRVEVWHGSAEGAPPESSAAQRSREADRLDALRQYYRGPVTQPVAAPSYPRYLASEWEADIHWVLEYIGTR